MKVLLEKQKDKIIQMTQKNSDRIDSGPNNGDINVVSSVVNNNGNFGTRIQLEKEKSTFQVSKSIFIGTMMFGNKFTRRDNTMNNELQGNLKIIFLKENG